MSETNIRATTCWRYQIVQRRSQHELSERVNAMLAECWKLQGGISVANEANGTYIYVQAMIKEAV